MKYASTFTRFNGANDYFLLILVVLYDLRPLGFIHGVFLQGMGFICGVCIKVHWFYVWSICKVMGFICGVFVLYPPEKYSTYKTHTFTNTSHIKPIPCKILHILNPYLVNMLHE